MAYVVYHVKTTRLLGKWHEHQYFATEGAAKAALTRAVNKAASRPLSYIPMDRNDWAIADARDFHENIERQVTKTNLLSGKEFTQPENTPLCCDPSSETYWSM